MTGEAVRELVEQEIAGEWSLTNLHGCDLRRCLVSPKLREYDDSGGGRPLVDPPPVIRLWLVLEETPLPRADPAAMAEALAEAAAERGLRDLDWSEGAKQLRARIARMQALEGAPWPLVSDAALAATAREWLAPYCNGMTKLTELKALDVGQMLLPGDLRRKLEAALPARLALPEGRSAAIDYTGEIPTLEARAQHLFGMGAMPKLAGGRLHLQVALLSPAGRPIAITSDLAGFWSAGWADVRKEMRGRYPKHNWPESPG